MFYRRRFLNFLFQSYDLPDVSANQREILQGDQY